MTNTSEIIVSNNHIDPKRDDGYMIVKLGYIHPPVSGKRQVSLLWGNDKKSDGATSTQVQTDWNQTDNTQPDYLKNKPTIPAAQVGDNTYLGLDDTSDTTYTGKDKFVPAVNEATGNLDLTETIAALLTLMADFPSSYSGAALKALRVNSGATAVEFYDALAAFIQNQEASAQATSKFWISGKARAGTGHFGGATDYSEFEADGTLKFNGAATVHDDLTGDITRTKTVGTRVTLDNTENTIDFTSAGTLSDYLFLSYQNKHAWKSGSDIKPHIHFEQASNAVPNFLIEYRWQRQGQTKTTAWTRIICNTLAISYTSGTINNIAYSAAITPPSGYSLSDIIQIRIIRDTANTSGLFSGADGYSGTVKVTAVDAHIELDTFGSRTEYAK